MLFTLLTCYQMIQAGGPFHALSCTLSQDVERQTRPFSSAESFIEKIFRNSWLRVRPANSLVQAPLTEVGRSFSTVKTVVNPQRMRSDFTGLRAAAESFQDESLLQVRAFLQPRTYFQSGFVPPPVPFFNLAYSQPIV